jgi:hypothetical protein
MPNPLPIYTKEEPLTVKIQGLDYELSAWPDFSVAGHIMVAVKCQKNDINYWRTKGVDIIAARVYSAKHAISGDSIMDLMFGDPATAFEEIKKQIADTKKQYPEELVGINRMNWILQRTLDYVQMMLQPSLDERAAQNKAKRAKTKKTTKK